MSKGFNKRRPSEKPVIPISNKLYDRKDISMVIQFHKRVRQPMRDEIFDQVLGEDTVIKRINNDFANQYHG